jgi:hypothetical protein
MDSTDDLQKEKSNILSNISQSATEGNSDSVLSASEKLDKIESLIDRHGQIVQEREMLREDKTNSNVTAPSAKQETPKKELKFKSMAAAARRHGEEIREAFLRRLTHEGVHLQLSKGKTIYLTKSGQRVGIAVATERQPNRWFLGLPIAGFDHAVLLCQRDAGDVAEIRLPDKFFSKYGSAMSQSKNQVLFKIVQKNNEVSVQVPGTEGIPVSSFSSDYSFLM